jgi:hypothetical protein
MRLLFLLYRSATEVVLLLKLGVAERNGVRPAGMQNAEWRARTLRECKMARAAFCILHFAFYILHSRRVCVCVRELRT